MEEQEESEDENDFRRVSDHSIEEPPTETEFKIVSETGKDTEKHSEGDKKSDKSAKKSGAPEPI